MDEMRRPLGSAIALMTAWAAQPDDVSFMAKVGADIASETPESEIELAVAMGNLCGILLIRLEKATGQAPDATLQDIAQRYGVGQS